MSRSVQLRSLSVCLILGLITLTGPALIHFAYRAATPGSARQSRAERYHFLANAEVADKSLTEDQRTAMRDERMKLFYWFHSRGWNIDEGDHHESWLLPWRELIRHWTGHTRNS